MLTPCVNGSLMVTVNSGYFCACTDLLSVPREEDGHHLPGRPVLEHLLELYAAPDSVPALTLLTELTTATIRLEQPEIIKHKSFSLSKTLENRKVAQSLKVYHSQKWKAFRTDEQALELHVSFNTIDLSRAHLNKYLPPANEVAGR